MIQLSILAAAGSWRIADNDILDVRSGKDSDKAVLLAAFLSFLLAIVIVGGEPYSWELEASRYKAIAGSFTANACNLTFVSFCTLSVIERV